MTTTLNSACPLCGLRFGGRPLLELHVREDHRQRARRDPGPAQAGAVQAGAAQVPPPRAAAPATHRSRPGRMTTGPRRVMHALRYADDELMRACEAIIRSARAA